jgi:hypothetical protein
MARPFWSATAEQVVAAVEAVCVNNKPTRCQFVAEFSDLPEPQAKAALDAATDMGLLLQAAGEYRVASPLCRFLSFPDEEQRAVFMRIVLESYEPFLKFRERLEVTSLASSAAQQTKVILDLQSHREEIKDTLISLGTYSHALLSEGGGRYRPEVRPDSFLEVEAKACREIEKGEARIRELLGNESVALISRQEVFTPLVDALIRASSRDAEKAVHTAANALESYLDALATRMKVTLSGATGINAKLEKFRTQGKLPQKLVHVGKYLGHIRNAADHGIDPEVSASWAIRADTGLNYVYVACSFIGSITGLEQNRTVEI